MSKLRAFNDSYIVPMVRGSTASGGVEKSENEESLTMPGPLPKPKSPAPKAPTSPDKKSGEARQPTLRLGDQGADGWVEYLQKLLNTMDPSPNLKLDGNFDSATYKAVIAFQKQEGLLVDGVVGNQTWAALRFADPEMAGTDGRAPHTFHEHGVEARWATEGPAFYTRSSDTLEKQVVSVGDETNIEGRKVNVFVIAPGSKRKRVVVAIGPRDAQSATTETGQGNVHLVVIRDFTKTFPSNPPGASVEDYLIEAHLEKELGGEIWTSKKHGIRVTDAPPQPKQPPPKQPPTPQTGTATLEAHVHEESGKLVEGATVRLSTGPTAKPDMQTNGQGIAKFEELADGDYHVNAAKRNIVWQPAYIRKGKLAPGQTVVVTLSKLAKPTAEVADLGVNVFLNGSPLKGANVTATPTSGGSPHAGQTNGSGAALLAGLPAGEYRVTAVDPGSGKTGNSSVMVEANKSQGVEIQISTGGGPPVEFSATLTVLVTGEGIPVKGANVTAFTDATPTTAAGGTTDRNGRVTLALKLGDKFERSFTVQAIPPDGARLVAKGTSVVVRGGSSSHVTLPLNRAPDWHDF